MKITSEHLNQLKSACAPLASKLKEHTKLFPERTESRIAWDLLWALPASFRDSWFREVYQYANDTHITTAAKRVVRELTA